MSVKINFKTDNAAFEDPNEIGRVIRMIATQIDSGKTSGIIRDSNGNKVGKFKK